MIMNLQENINRVRQIMGLTTEGRNKIFSLDYVKNKIADATSWEDFKEKNPKWAGMYNFIIYNYDKDTWQDLISVFDNKKTKHSLDLVKNKIEDATSWEDFKQKNPNWVGMYKFVINNYDKDTWQDLISVFDNKKTKHSLDLVKNKIADATSWKDFKEKNPNWKYMYGYIYQNHKNDPDNNWEDLISVFEDAPIKYSLDDIKKRIADATSFEDFKEKNPNWKYMYGYIYQNNKNDQYNNWTYLTSHFDDAPIKYSLDDIKKRIADATSWKDFKQKNSYWKNMRGYIQQNNKNDQYNNWESLTSHFDDKYQPNSESKGEKKVKSSLIDLGYDVSTQKRFKGCYGLKGNRYCDLLKFDAYVETKNGKKVCIEFDGEQHFMSVGFFGGDIRLEEQQKHDQLKNDYCKNNGIKLIRIHYLDFNRIAEILKNELGPYEQENMDNNMNVEIFYSIPEKYQHLT